MVGNASSLMNIKKANMPPEQYYPGGPSTTTWPGVTQVLDNNRSWLLSPYGKNAEEETTRSRIRTKPKNRDRLKTHRMASHPTEVSIARRWEPF